MSTDRERLHRPAIRASKTARVFGQLLGKREIAMLQLFAVTVSAALQDKKGISALEYAILAGVLIGVISAAVTAFGSDITTLFSSAGST
jgi:Flp pilus assembly pilin Flp